MPLDNPSPVESLITGHIDIWTSAIKRKSSSGRGSRKKIELYGIKKLRELILELAVRGKLVAQDANDEPASVLLERIAEEKAHLLSNQGKAGKIKKPKKLPEITEDEKPFELPKGWEFVQLSTVFNSIISGGTPSKRENEYWGGDIPWASVKDLGLGRHISTTQDYITQTGLDNGSKLALKGELLICTRMGLGKIAIVDKPMAFNQDLKSVSLSSGINIEFFLNYYSTLNIKGTGTTVAGISQDQLLSFILAIPPFEEQHRIVTKVDELMALCDELEAQTESSLGAHQTLVTVLLDTLVNSQDADELAENWTRLSDHFDTLFITEHSIEQLKQTVLQLAVMGKLVPQDPNDEPASVLLERIAAEKEQLIKDKKIKKQKPLPPISDDEKPFQLPSIWKFGRLGEILQVISDYHANGGYKTLKENVELLDAVDYAIMLRTTNFSDKNYNNYKYITERAYNFLDKSKLYSGDIVMNKIGDPGASFYVDDRGKPMSLAMNLFLLRVQNVSSKYVFLYLNGNYDYIRGFANGTSTQTITKEAVASLVFSLPPLEEQHRIVAKVDELMALCDLLKVRLNDAQTTQLQLADALVEQAL